MSLITAQNRLDCYRLTTNYYTQPGTVQFKRHWEFMTETKQNTISQASHLIAFIVVGIMAVNIVTAKACKGNAVVGKLGTAAGACGGVLLYVKFTESRLPYQKWIASKMDDIINAESIAKYSEDAILANFLCPISQMVALIPTRTPNGHLFDLEYLRKIPKDQKGQTPCPMRGDPFDITQLSLDCETALVINKRLLYLIKQDILHAKNDPAIKKTLETQAELINKAIITNYLNCLSLFDCRMANCITKASECTTERTEFMACFGESTDVELNWKDMNWKAILDKRWLKLNPGTIVLDNS